jgi:protein phosphatase
MPYKIHAYGMSDIGLVRENNEDVWVEIPKQNTFVLADGMGGHRAGEVAASEAVSTFSNHVKKIFGDSVKNFSLGEIRNEIEYAIQLVNTHVYDMGCQNRELRGMGTTFCCLHFHHDGVVHGHVGDSRIYRVRRGEMTQLTKDHSLLSELVDLGQLDEEEAEGFIYKNIITKAVGTEPFVEPSVHVSDVEEGDIYLMCSDGLSDLISDDVIASILHKKLNRKEKAKKLIDLAKEKGGHDNITVVLLEVEEIDHGGKDLSR